MASNTLGTLFRITTWGESHGKALGVVIDGCPAGLELSTEEIADALIRRAPGQNSYTSPRREPDTPEIYSGVFEGKTTGAPISILIHNQNIHSQHYEPIKSLLRPGHANFTYLAKYGVFDYRGGGRASARETVCRVAAGAVAQKLLAHYGIHTLAYLSALGPISIPALQNTSFETQDFKHLKKQRDTSPLFCPDPSSEALMKSALETARDQGDSLGGVISFISIGLPPGLGDPVYEKLEAKLASAMLSIPASKGFEIGEGFLAAQMTGSSHNDLFIQAGSQVHTQSNHAGGTLGGISTGMPLVGRVAFKPTSSIQISQATLTLKGEAATLKLPEGSRHDPCVAIRAVPIVEAMCHLVLADLLLMNQTARLSHLSLGQKT